MVSVDAYLGNAEIDYIEGIVDLGISLKCFSTLCIASNAVRIKVLILKWNLFDVEKSREALRKLYIKGNTLAHYVVTKRKPWNKQVTKIILP